MLKSFLPANTVAISSDQARSSISRRISTILITFFLLMAVGWKRHELLDDWLLGVEFPSIADNGGAAGGSILLTGASSGIGRATCGYLAGQHPNVTIYCGIRISNPFDAATKDYPFTLPNVRAVHLDVTNQTQVEAAMVRIMEKEEEASHPLIGIVCNAGIAELGTLEYQSLEVIERHYQVNVLGTLRVTQAALPLFRQQQNKEGGRVVWVSSVSALVPGFPRWGAYSSSKAALETLGDSLRREVQPYNISVSLVEPGFLSTRLTEKVGQRNQAIFDNKNSCDDYAGITHEEREAYPHIYGTDLVRLHTAMMNHGGSLLETAQAIEHALFSKYPRTRYMTSRVGILPTWLFVRLLRNMWPTDRWDDVFAGWLDCQRLQVYLQGIQHEIKTKGGFIKWMKSFLFIAIKNHD